VATIVYSARALDHIESAFQFLHDKNPNAAGAAVTAIQSAVDNLAAHPLVGQRIEGELRELVISYGETGYVALYRFVARLDDLRKGVARAGDEPNAGKTPELAPAELQDDAEHLNVPTVSTVDGVAQVNVFGAKRYAVRVRVKPDALAVRNIGLDEISAALKAANVNTPVGTLEGPKQTLVLQANKQLRSAAEFADLIVSTKGGNPVRLRDVANVEDSLETLKLSLIHI
jgi:plasmid stabilization system protein ParE